MSEFKSRGPLPPPSVSLSPPLCGGATHTGPGSMFGTSRVGDPYNTTYSAMSRPGYNQTYSNSHETSRYSNQYFQAQRATDPYPFASTNGAYHHSGTMSNDTTARAASALPDGPPFEETKVIHRVVTSRNAQLMPDILASIQKGFFQVDHKWTCYRRNYFTVSCSFNFRTSSLDGQLYLQRHATTEPIRQFAVAITAKTAVMNTNQESEVRALVQHTPKRDKATESVPGRVTLQPAPPPSISASGGLSANSILYTSSQQLPTGMLVDYNPSYPSSQHQTTPTAHTFERIQFQKATANNGKRRAQQQYFHIVVELSADISRPGDASHWVKIATKQSNPMVVRGRSPGHYKDNVRRDSTTSMDPDRGSGAGGDSSNLSSMHHLSAFGSRSHPSSMEWEGPHRGSGNMGGGYRRARGSEYSPPSTASADSLPDSPANVGMLCSDTQTVRSARKTEHDRWTVLHHSDAINPIHDVHRDVPILAARDCTTELILPRTNSAHQQEFGIYGHQHFDTFATPRLQEICPS